MDKVSPSLPQIWVSPPSPQPGGSGEETAQLPNVAISPAQKTYIPDQPVSSDLLRELCRRRGLIVNTPAFILSKYTHSAATPIPPKQQRYIEEKFQNWLLIKAVKKEEWESRCQLHAQNMQILEKLYLEKDSKKSPFELHCIQANIHLHEYLVNLAREEEEGEPIASILALTMDQKIINQEMASGYIRPSIDWRSLYKPVLYIPVTVTSLKKSKKYPPLSSTSLKKPIHPPLSSKWIKAQAKEAGIPHVAYAPAAYYNDGTILFALRSNSGFLQKFSPSKQREIVECEEMLLDTGATKTLYRACWSFFCEYSIQISKSGKTIRTIEDMCVRLDKDIKRWMGWLDSNSSSSKMAKLFSLMIDNLNWTLVECNNLIPKGKNQAFPGIDWREAIVHPSMTQGEILVHYDISESDTDLETEGEYNFSGSSESTSLSESTSPSEEAKALTFRDCRKREVYQKFKNLSEDDPNFEELRIKYFEELQQIHRTFSEGDFAPPSKKRHQTE